MSQTISKNSSADGNIDEAAQQFIHGFRQNLQLERLNSLAAVTPPPDNTRKLKKGENYNLNFNLIASGEKDVDQSAEAFISKFRQNLKMQREESIKRYKQMIENGHSID
ncbi:hypothetical protein SUGI_0021450 [Cryptomeria japonica]|nr:hypothetical protein SUGI_0021450 [Cryptomeria japonica]